VIAIDTNLLVYAHRSATPEPKTSSARRGACCASPGGWGFSIGNILEFWSVVTHPAAKGRPSTPNEAKKFIRSLVDQGGAAIWLPAPGFDARFLDTATRLSLVGPRVFDLQIALTALDHGVREMWTHDAGFIHLPGLSVHDPLEEDSHAEQYGRLRSSRPRRLSQACLFDARIGCTRLRTLRT
jgi:predicted nucleic acid-binding protein